MFLKHFLLLFCAFVLISSVSTQNYPQLSNPITPHHYEVILTIDVETKRFYAEEFIHLSVLQDVTELQINSNGLECDWLQSRLINDEGQEFIVSEASMEYDEYSEVLYLRFPEMIRKNTNYKLHLKNLEGSFGMGLIEYPLPSEKYLLTTGFNNTHLRQVFPCFDQPEFRTTFDFSVYHTEGYKLLINGDEMETSDGPVIGVDGKLFTSNLFSISTPLPTSSIGLMLTNMDVYSSSDNRVRVYHTDKEVAHILLKNYHNLLLSVEDEFKIPSMFPKLDVVYVPTMTPSQTSTKWGLIAVNEEMSPVEDSVLYSLELKEIQKEIARSVYQLVFGQLINPEWWTFRWITMGLARYFSGVTKHLPFDAEKEFLVDTVQLVTSWKGIHILYWMEYSMYNMDNINSPINSLMVDHKAGAMLRMVANSMGEENFKAAIINLLSTNPWTTINRNQFVDQLNQHSTDDIFPPGHQGWSQTIEALTWVTNIEILRVKYSNATGYAIETFAFSRTLLPTDYLTPTIPAASKPIVWVASEYLTESTVGHVEEPWLIINPQQFGSFRAVYSDDLYKDLTRHLSNNHTQFPESVREQLIVDSGSQADEGYLELRRHLFLIQYLVNETDTAVWGGARRSFERLSFRMRGYGKMELFYESFIALASGQYSKNRIGGREFAADFEKTMEVGKIMCYSGHEGCVQDVEQYYEERVKTGLELKGSKDFQKFIYCTLAKFSKKLEEEMVDHVLQLWLKDRGIFAISRTALAGLACTSNSEIIKRFLEFATTDRLQVEYGVSLSPVERLFLLRTFLHGSYESVVQSLEFILGNFPMVAGVIPELMSDLFTGFREFVSTPTVSRILRDLQSIEAEEMTEKLQRLLRNEEVLGYFNEIDSTYLQRQFELWVLEKANGHGNSIRGVGFLVTLVMGLVVQFIW